MAKLRYDLAAEAILSLQHYLDTCSDDRNTMALLKGAEKAVQDLVAVERKVKQRHDAGASYGSNVTKALDEVEKRVAQVGERVAPLRAFMVTYSEELIAIKDALARIQDLANVISSMSSVERQLEKVKRQISVI